MNVGSGERAKKSFVDCNKNSPSIHEQLPWWPEASFCVIRLFTDVNKSRVFMFLEINKFFSVATSKKSNGSFRFCHDSGGNCPKL